MDVNLGKALGAVKLAVGDAAGKAAVRRLTVLKDRAPCRAGCNGCCSRLITVTVAEATVMLEHLESSGSWKDVKKRALEVARLSQEVAPLAWFKMNLKCPVLNPSDGTCSAYAVRPPQCSTHFVTSDPGLCDPWSPSPGGYEQYEMDDLKAECDSRVEASVDGFGVLAMRLPLPVALLVAERVRLKTSLSVQEAISLLYNEL